VIEVVERLGEAPALALGGLLIGAAFGALAQHSRFCLRAATIEFASGKLGGKVAIWVLTFATAVAGTQAAIVSGLLDVSEARQLSAAGSLSGALIGGLIFGCGMVLARGCASRLLVLSATGNLRALVSGLILTVVAQASFRGVLAPLREALAGLWVLPAGSVKSLLEPIGAGAGAGLGLGLAWLLIGLLIARHNRVALSHGLAATGVGLMVAAGWVFTYAMSQVSFDPVAVKSITFTGPSADTLMGLINERTLPLGFDIGLVPGVFLGSLAATLIAGEWRLQGFEGGQSMARYIAGASLMGFGGMLAGGCAVGAGVTGGAVFALTAWCALAAMWLGAGTTDYLVDRRGQSKVQATHATPTSTTVPDHLR